MEINYLQMIELFKKHKSKVILVSLALIILISFFNNDTSTGKHNIGIVEIEGTILESDKIIENLNIFNDRDDIKAIIVRLNTPGGSVAPSQEIYEKVKKIAYQNKKPIIASVSSVAASGGYYIAIGAHKIIANPGSITGSIGVIMSYPIAKDLIEKIGMEFQTIKSGQLKDSGSPYRYANKQDSIYFKSIVNDLHNQFVEQVSIQRKISRKDIDKYCDGRIFTGKKAYEINLVDTLGTFEDALNISKNLANISGETNLIYPKVDRGNLLKILLEETKSWVDFFNEIPMYIYK